jgi:hypothetical protein
MRQPRMVAEPGIAGSQHFTLGTRDQFRHSRDFANGFRM